MRLIERDEQTAELQRTLRLVETGAGRIIVVIGDAGLGKTALLKHFRSRVERQASVLWGMCDDLYTPQALAPFYDIAFQLGGDLPDLLTTASKLHLVGHRLLDRLRGPAKPTVLIIEDIHWADEASLDLIRFLSRRLETVPVLLLLTLRDHAVTQSAKLHALLGGLPAEITRRIELAPLSRSAVRQLATAGGRDDADSIYRLTDGNPFYVTELLASEVNTLPRTVRDAVLARAAQLSPSARHVLDVVSLVPNHAEEWLVRAVADLTDAALTELLASGMLLLQQGFLTFRHELARRAVVETLPVTTARTLHRAIFHALHQRRESGLARLVHHAAYGDLGRAVIELAPRAAQQASAVNAHREAAAHYATALRYTSLLTPDQRADLLEARAHASYLGVHWEVAVHVYEQALAIRRELGQAEHIGDILRRLSRLAWGLTRVRESRQYAVEAVRTLRRLPPGRLLALAYSMLGQWHMHQNNVAPTLYWSAKAVALAIHEPEPRIDALTNIGTVLSKGADVPAGIRQLQASLDLALEADVPDQAARTYFNLTMAFIEQQQLDRALALAQAAHRYTDERDLNTYLAGMAALKAMIAFHQGQWAQAERLAQGVIDTFALTETRGVAPLISAATLAQIAARRGAADAPERVDNLLHGTQGHRQLAEDAGFVYLPRAEAAWLRGDYGGCMAEAQAMLDGQSYVWYQSWASFWLWRCGVPVSGTLIEPHRLQIAGDWRGAAAAWEARGFPYDRAMALADGDVDALHDAFRILDRLGAHAAMDFVRKRLRDLGAASVPRGMNTSTRASAAGLTRRQSEVLALLALTNAEIAARLHISPKTVEHHVSAILARLDVATRDDAIRVARSLEGET